MSASTSPPVLDLVYGCSGTSNRTLKLQNYFFWYGSDVSHIEVDPISSVRGGHISRGSTEPWVFHDDSLGSFIQIRSQGRASEMATNHDLPVNCTSRAGTFEQRYINPSIDSPSLSPDGPTGVSINHSSPREMPPETLTTHTHRTRTTDGVTFSPHSLWVNKQ